MTKVGLCFPAERQVGCGEAFSHASVDRKAYLTDSRRGEQMEQTLSTYLEVSKLPNLSEARHNAPQQYHALHMRFVGAWILGVGADPRSLFLGD